MYIMYIHNSIYITHIYICLFIYIIIYYSILRKFRTERDRSTQQPPLLGDWPPLELSVRSMNCEMMGARKIKMGPRINTCELF